MPSIVEDATVLEQLVEEHTAQAEELARIQLELTRWLSIFAHERVGTLARMRLRRHKSQIDMAQAADVPQAYISYAETGRWHQMKPEVALRILKTYAALTV